MEWGTGGNSWEGGKWGKGGQGWTRVEHREDVEIAEIWTIGKFGNVKDETIGLVGQT